MPEGEAEDRHSSPTPKAHSRDAGSGGANLGKRFPFLTHNRKLREKIETWQTRMRRHDLPDLDQALFSFYAARLQDISSRHELQRRLAAAESGFLCAAEADLAGARDLRLDTHAFPDSVVLGGAEVPLSYSYSPGEETDGVTLRLPLAVAESVSPASVEWAVPGLREAQIQELLRALPKSLRRELMPLGPKAAELAASFSLGPVRSVTTSRKRFSVAMASRSRMPHGPPRPCRSILCQESKSSARARRRWAPAGTWTRLRKQLREVKTQAADDAPEWARLAEQWERFGLASWNFPDVPNGCW